MSRHFFTRNMIKNVTKWRRARSAFVQFGTGYKASCTTALSHTHHAPRGSVQAGKKVPVSNVNYKPGLYLTVLQPTALAANISDAGADLQRNVYKAADDYLVEQLWTAFLVRQWRCASAYLSLFVFDPANTSNEVANLCAQKYGAFMHVYRVVSSSATSADVATRLAPLPTSGFSLILDGDDGLTTLLGMQRGGIVLIRPDEYVSYVGNALDVKQLQKNSGAFCQYLKRFYL